MKWLFTMQTTAATIDQRHFQVIAIPSNQFWFVLQFLVARLGLDADLGGYRIYKGWNQSIPKYPYVNEYGVVVWLLRILRNQKTMW